MRSRGPLRPALLFVVATILALSSTIQAWRLQMLSEPGDGSMHLAFQLLILNGVYWFVPASLAPFVVGITRRYRLGHTRWSTALGVHILSAFAYSLIHTSILLITRALLFPNGGRGLASATWWSYIQRQYLMQLDWLLATYFFLVGLGHAVAYWQEAQDRAVNAERLQRQLVEAQLEALQRQLQPHFLFNTLHTISGLMRNDVEGADLMIDRLSDLLRMSLRTVAQEVTVKEELELLQKYLEIEQTRFRDRLTIRIDVKPDVLDAYLPHFLLQPLVENAVLHGIAPRSRPGRIEIGASRTGQTLTLDIRDSGDGVPPDTLAAFNDGVGLSNTRARLQHLYGADHAFTFANLPGGGFGVTVTIPFRAATPTAPPVRQRALDTINAEVA
jgi:hypothetical protein